MYQCIPNLFLQKIKRHLTKISTQKDCILHKVLIN